MSNIAERQNVLIYRFLNASPTWDQQIYIDFIPDEVIVRSIVFRNAGEELGASFIRTNLVKDDFLGSIADSVANNPQQHFTLKKQINGSYNFQVITSAGIPDDTLVGGLIISLEFIKYK